MWPGQLSWYSSRLPCDRSQVQYPLPTQPGWGLTQPSIPLCVGKISTSKHRVGQHLPCLGCKVHTDLNHLKVMTHTKVG